VHPVSPDRWPDLERLFGPRGGAEGCWCMWWRISRAEFSSNGSKGNRQGLRRLVQRGEVPGLLAYVDGEPAGWVSIDRRERYESLERSRVLPRVDDRPVWSVVCFYIGRKHRRNGLQRQLIEAAVGYARDHGARVVEAYPTPWKGAGSTYMGLEDEFAAAGFRRVRDEPRPVVRRAVRPRRATT
jgi:GNAT superfamily N-acetyltransferase